MLVGRGNWKSQSRVAFGLMLSMPSPEIGILSRKKMRKAGNKTGLKWVLTSLEKIDKNDLNS